jgi:hypothetical protein
MSNSQIGCTHLGKLLAALFASDKYLVLALQLDLAGSSLKVCKTGQACIGIIRWANESSLLKPAQFYMDLTKAIHPASQRPIRV